VVTGVYERRLKSRNSAACAGFEQLRAIAAEARPFIRERDFTDIAVPYSDMKELLENLATGVHENDSSCIEEVD
jgi:hypothetical protein